MIISILFVITIAGLLIWAEWLKKDLTRKKWTMADKKEQQHIHCGTPKCCGKCESAKKTVKKDENIRKDDKKNDWENGNQILPV